MRSTGTTLIFTRSPRWQNMAQGRFKVRITWACTLSNFKDCASPANQRSREVLLQGWNPWGQTSVIYPLRSVRRQNHNWDDRLKDQIFKNKYPFSSLPTKCRHSWIHWSFFTSCLLRNLTREVVTRHILKDSIMLIFWRCILQLPSEH